MQPERRCSIVSTKGKHFLLLSIVDHPKPAPEIEPLMFFENSPVSSPSSSSVKEQILQSSNSNTKCVILEVTENGELMISPWFSSSDLHSFSEAYRALDLHQTDTVLEFPVAFGCLLLDKLYVLVATEVEKGASLPCGGIIWRVTQTLWVPLVLPGGELLGMTSSDRSRLQEFQDYNHSSGYYYSENANLELPFPFTRSEKACFPNLHCNWSEKISQSIIRAGVTGYNISLIRGFVGEQVLVTNLGEKLHILLLGRQNKCNPGPRYYGRGLDSNAAAGNEHFYEYVMWKESSHSVAYAKHILFRGTVPLYWATEGVESQMVFDPKRVFTGTETYFHKLFYTAKKNMELESSSVEIDPRICCLNLLRQDAQQQESLLTAYFNEGVQRTKKNLSVSFSQGYLDICSFDWLSFSKTFGIQAAVEELWRKVIPFLITSTSHQDSPMSLGLIDSSGVVDRLLSQSRFLRINCADSLDRTNLGCFFVCLQCTVGMLSVLQVLPTAFQSEPEIPLLTSREAACKYPSFASEGKSSVPAPYLTTWDDVVSGKKVASAVVRALAQLFTANGDCVARLYTNSAAMHGNLLRTISGAKYSTANALIATQRFFENTFEDRKKNRNLDLLLGENRTTYFSSQCWVFFTLPLPRRQWSQAVVCSGILRGTTSDHLCTVVEEIFQKKRIDSSAVIRICLQHEDSPPDKAENDGPRIAVILLASHSACIELLQKRHIFVKNAVCTLSPYHYDIEYPNEKHEKGMTAALKDGFRQLVRGIS